MPISFTSHIRFLPPGRPQFFFNVSTNCWFDDISSTNPIVTHLSSCLTLSRLISHIILLFPNVADLPCCTGTWFSQPTHHPFTGSLRTPTPLLGKIRNLSSFFNHSFSGPPLYQSHRAALLFVSSLILLSRRGDNNLLPFVGKEKRTTEPTGRGALPAGFDEIWRLREKQGRYNKMATRGAIWSTTECQDAARAAKDSARAAPSATARCSATTSRASPSPPSAVSLAVVV